MGTYLSLGIIMGIIVFILWLAIPLFIQYSGYVLYEYYQYAKGKDYDGEDLIGELGVHFMIALVVGAFSIILYPALGVILPVVITIYILRRRNIKKNNKNS